MSTERNGFSEILNNKNIEIAQLRSSISNLNDYKVLYETVKLNDSQYHSEISILTANYQQEINDLRKVENDHLLTINNLRNDLTLAENEKERILFTKNEMYEEIGYLKETNNKSTREFEILKKNFEELSRQSTDLVKAAKLEHEKSTEAQRELMEQLSEYKEGLGKYNNLNNIIDFLQLELTDIAAVQTNRNDFDIEAYRSDLRALARKLTRIITDNNSAVNANIRVKSAKVPARTAPVHDLKSKSPLKSSSKKPKSPAVKHREATQRPEVLAYYSVPSNLKAVIHFICRVIEQISHFQEDLVNSTRQLCEQTASIASASEVMHKLESRVQSSKVELNKLDSSVGSCSGKIVDLINSISSFLNSSGAGIEAGRLNSMDNPSASLDTLELDNVSTINNVSALKDALFNDNEILESTFSIPADGNRSNSVFHHSKGDQTSKLKTNINFLEIQINTLFAEIEKLKKNESLLIKKASSSEKSISDMNRVYELQLMECKRLYDTETEKLFENFSLQMHNVKEKLQASEANSKRIEIERNNDIRLTQMQAESALNEKLKDYIVRLNETESERSGLCDRIGDLSMCVEHLTSHSLKQEARVGSLLSQKRLLVSMCSKYASAVAVVKEISGHIASDCSSYYPRDRSHSDRKTYKLRWIALHIVAAIRFTKTLAESRRSRRAAFTSNCDDDGDVVPKLFHQEFDTSFAGEDSWTLPRRKDLARCEGNAAELSRLIMDRAKASSSFYKRRYVDKDSTLLLGGHSRIDRYARTRPTSQIDKSASFFGQLEVARIKTTMVQMNKMISTLSQQLKHLTEKEMEMSAYIANQTSLHQEHSHALSDAHRTIQDEERRLREKMNELKAIEMEHMRNLQSMKFHRTSPLVAGAGAQSANARGGVDGRRSARTSPPANNKLSYDFELDSPTGRGSQYNDLYISSLAGDSELQHLVSECNFLTKSLHKSNIS